jgi:hypothetical protein
MKRTILIAAAVLASAVSLRGDVTIKQNVSGKGMAVISGASTTYIKGMKMRTDMEARGTVMSTIFDVENQKMYVFDSKKKSADVWDMQAFSAEMAKNVDVGEMKTSLQANKEKKEIAGKTANGYDLSVSVPANLGGSADMQITVSLQGPVWIVKNAPGTADYVAFYKAATEKGWIFSDPRAAKGSPGQAKAMAEMQKQLAAAGGLPYESTVEISLSGDGPMAAMMARMGGMSLTTTITSIETAGLDDSLFAPPAGYKLVPKK